MTMGLIYPPRLRTSLQYDVPCDPAEINTFQSSGNRLPVNELQKSSSLPTRKCSHSGNRRRHRRNVSFHNEVTVVEVERVPKSESTGVWYTFGEMDQFRSEAAKSKERRRTGMKRSARSSSHAKKVLVQQCVSEELDGIPSDPKVLSIIACNSSQKARECAHRSAQKLEKEIKKESYSYERPIYLTSELPSINMQAVDGRRISNFYWGAVVDAFTDTVTCGMASKVAH